MATVYVARKIGAAGFERLVVIKRVHRHLLANTEFCNMFRDEARICATLRHPNVVPVTDVVESEGELFLVLDYVESLSLSALLKAASSRAERIPPALLVRILADTLAGLHAAHEAVDLRGQRLELIHRDVSPQNIIVGLDGSSRLIDFGIAKAASRISVTHSGALKGKLRYMAPEQIRQLPLDRRADVFAAGVVLFEALTGEKLFTGEDEGDIVLGILALELPAPSSRVPDLPVALDAVVARALARDRRERFQTAAEFQDALEHAVGAAPPREVTRLVERYGGAQLESLRASVQATLEGGPRSGQALDVARPELRTDGSLLTTETERPPYGSTTRASWRALAVLALAGVAIAAFMLGLTRPRPVAMQAPAPDVSASAPAAAPTVSATSSSLATASATAIPPPASAAPPPEPTARPRKTERPRPLPEYDVRRKNPYGPP
jgi:serine/threonine-protein kinase